MNAGLSFRLTAEAGLQMIQLGEMERGHGSSFVLL